MVVGRWEECLVRPLVDLEDMGGRISRQDNMDLTVYYLAYLWRHHVGLKTKGLRIRDR